MLYSERVLSPRILYYFSLRLSRRTQGDTSTTSRFWLILSIKIYNCLQFGGENDIIYAKGTEHELLAVIFYALYER